MSSNSAMCAAVTAASYALSDWTANAAADPELESSGWHTFLIAGSFGSAFSFWRWLARPFGGDPSFVDGRCPDVDLNGARAFLCAVEGGGRIWAEWPDSVPDCADFEIEDVDDGIAVRWTQRAEAKLRIADALAAFVIREGCALHPLSE